MNQPLQSNQVPSKALYQAPRIETVMTASDLQRELFYAGNPVSTPTPVPL